MELLDSSMGQVSDIVYKKLKQVIPEDVLGKMTVAVRMEIFFKCFHYYYYYYYYYNYYYYYRL